MALGSHFNVWMEAFDEAIQVINKRFEDQLWLDFEVTSILNGILHIKASTDFCYYHQCEITMSGVQYFSGPLHWGTNPPSQLIELIPEIEAIRLINTHKLETPCSVIAFNTDEPHRVLIAANTIHFNLDTVYYYERENLRSGERIDESVHIDRKITD